MHMVCVIDPMHIQFQYRQLFINYVLRQQIITTTFHMEDEIIADDYILRKYSNWNWNQIASSKELPLPKQKKNKTHYHEQQIVKKKL